MHLLWKLKFALITLLVSFFVIKVLLQDDVLPRSLLSDSISVKLSIGIGKSIGLVGLSRESSYEESGFVVEEQIMCFRSENTKQPLLATNRCVDCFLMCLNSGSAALKTS